MKKLINILIIFLPWKIRRWILNKFYHYEIHPTARIGLSYIYPEHLIMGEGARIGHLNVAIHLELIQMDKNSSVSQKNWITGFPLRNKSNFQDYPNRKPYLVMEEGSAITKQHHIDCTDIVTIGRLTIISGYGTQILTHSYSIKKNEQGCEPVNIGHHCFVGTRSIILPGSVLPPQSVLGAGAVLKKKFTESFSLYGGVPAKLINKMEESCEFFHRKNRSQ